MVVVRYGAALNTERGSEGITMGVTLQLCMLGVWNMKILISRMTLDGFFQCSSML